MHLRVLVTICIVFWRSKDREAATTALQERELLDVTADEDEWPQEPDMNSTAPAAGTDARHEAGEEPCAPGQIVEPVDPPDDEVLAQLAKALGHPARVRILRLLAARSTCITGDVVAELPLAQSTVSEHLRVLREAGLVQGTPEGTKTAYCVSPTGLALLKRGIAEL